MYGTPAPPQNTNKSRFLTPNNNSLKQSGASFNSYSGGMTQRYSFYPHSSTMFLLIIYLLVEVLLVLIQRK